MPTSTATVVLVAQRFGGKDLVTVGALKPPVPVIKILPPQNFRLG